MTRRILSTSLMMCTPLLGLFFNLAPDIAQAADARGELERALNQDPQLQALDAAALRETEMARSLSLLENPSLDVTATDRKGTAGPSSVVGFGLRQRLPLWTARTREARLRDASAENLTREKPARRQELELQWLSRFYQWGLLKTEVSYLRDRQARFDLVREALSRTRAASISQQADRDLMRSALAILEAQAERKNVELKSVVTEFNSIGVESTEGAKPKWIDAKAYRAIAEKVSGWKERAAPGRRSSENEERLASLQAEQLRIRPGLEIFANSDRERGGGEERNTAIGLSVSLPLDGLIGHERAAARASREAQSLITKAETREEKAARGGLRHRMTTTASLLEKFPMEEITRVEKNLKETERKVRQGWIAPAQFLEFDRQSHGHIETILQAQRDAADSIAEACMLFECDDETRRLLGGQL